MSETLEIHVLRPNNPKFLPRVRQPGYTTYECLPARKTLQAALIALAKEFATGKYKQGDVLMVTNDYFEPSVIAEITQ